MSLRRQYAFLLCKKPNHGHRDDLQIEGQAPVAQIIQIVLDPFRNRSIATPSVYLRPPCDSGLEQVARVVAIELFQKRSTKNGRSGRRPHDAHIPSQNVEKLGNSSRLVLRRKVPTAFAAGLDRRSSGVVPRGSPPSSCET